MLLSKQRKAQIAKGNRILVTINFLRSAGPMRFVVYEEELVATVIDMALKSYSREGRLPVLGSDLNDFLLYCFAAGSEALNPWETIGSRGSRNFTLSKKPQAAREADEEASSPTTTVARKGSGSWKAWINKSLNFKIASH